MSTKQILCHVEMLAKALVLIFLEQLLNGDHAIKEKKMNRLCIYVVTRRAVPRS